jgi:hypothetical protein
MYLIHPAALGPGVSQPLTEMRTKNIKIVMFQGSKVRRVRRVDNLDNVGSLTSHNPRPPRPVTGIALLYLAIRTSL